MKKLILFFMALTLVSSMSFAARKRVFIDGKPKMLEITNIFEYDKDGNLMKDYEHPFEYNGKGQLIKSFEYDENNHRNTITYEYNEDGKLSKKSKSMYDFSGEVIYYSYDDKGNLTFEGNCKEQEKSTKYSYQFYDIYENGRKTFSLLKSCISVNYNYDDKGNLVKVTYTDPYADEIYEDVYEYNEKNQLVKKILQRVPTEDKDEFKYEKPGQTVIYDYDDNGNTIYIEDLINGSILREYDDNNRVIYEFKSKGLKIKKDQEQYFEYDDRGNIITIKENITEDLGEVVNNRKDENGSLITKKFEYEYSPNDNLISYKEYTYKYFWGYVDENIVAYKNEYDDSNRVIKTTYDSGKIFLYEYEDLDNGGYKKYEYCLN